EKPQYVVLVKLDSPRGAYYGGEIAAPVTSVVLRAALAARNAALDRSELASVERDIPLAPQPLEGQPAETVTVADALVEDSAVAGPEPAAERMPQPSKMITLPWVSRNAAPDRSLRAVPDVRGLSTRSAVRALHRAGFRVTLATRQSASTIPETGTLLPAGSVVKLQHIP
ncbi:MAG TPA: PASTA domain-containing protein, partial [Gemmatimonadaceae bacterium]